MSAELRERLYVFYERFNPENAVRVDEIARTYAGREVELWTELSRKYGPEAVELAAAEHQRRRNARYAPQPQPRAPEAPRGTPEGSRSICAACPSLSPSPSRARSTSASSTTPRRGRSG
mmetsp:Transcript_19210/g.66200  ORF Transcript_19210/g.66200 Transcript_19210/m.66200 type:complete len:119 (-) Transcript_19210:1465-1821(-)